MSLRAAAIRLAAMNEALRPHLLGLLKDAAYYRNDPRWIIAKYPGVDKKGNRFKKGDDVLYWPSTKEVMAGEYAKDAWKRFQSEKGDEEGMPYAMASVTAGEEGDGPDVGGMMKALADAFEKASKEKLSDEDSKEMLNAFEKLLKTLPKDVQKEARDAAAAAAKKKSGGNLMRVASPIFLIAAAAAANSASKHPPTTFGPSVGEMLEEEFVHAAKSMVKAVGDVAKKVGGALKGAFDKLRGAHKKVEDHFEKNPPKSSGPRTYKDYTEEKKSKGEKPLSREQWEARFKK